MLVVKVVVGGRDEKVVSALAEVGKVDSADGGILTEVRGIVEIDEIEERIGVELLAV